MKTLFFKLFVTNVQELITGLDLIKDDDLNLSESDLLAGKEIKPIVQPRCFKKVAYTADLDNLFTDPIILANLDRNLVLQGKEGVMFIGDSDLVVEFAKYIKAGKVGLVAESIDVNGFPRAYWSSEDKNLFLEVLHFLDPEKSNDDKPAEDKPAEDKPADKPADEKPAEAKPAKKPAKKSAAKKGGKPKAEKPAEDKPAEDKPVEDKPADAEKPADEVPDACCDSLEALFVRKVVNGDNGCEGCGAEETAEQTARRLCAEEGIEYDADADIAGHK